MGILTVYLRPIFEGHIMNKAVYTLLVALLLASCGQTGPLMLPEAAPADEQPAAEQSGQ